MSSNNSQPLSPDDVPKTLRDAVVKARRAWLRNTEVAEILQCSQLPLSKEAAWLPASGTIYLFNRRSVRFFRKDGFDWKKKSDNKTVKEVHEKLKIGSQEALNCYYAHAHDGMQRRCYWLLNGNDAIVLVHYLNTRPTKLPTEQPSWAIPGAATPRTMPASAPTISRTVALSFCEGASVSSFSATQSSLAVESASGSFTITTGHTARPVAEFRLNSKSSVDALGQRLSSVGVETTLPPGIGLGPGPNPFTMPSLPRSPFLSSPRAKDAAPHGFDDAVLSLNRGGALPGEAMPPPAVREAEEQASAVVSAFARRRSTRTTKHTAFVPYNSTSGIARRTSQPAVSAFE